MTLFFVEIPIRNPVVKFYLWIVFAHGGENTAIEVHFSLIKIDYKWHTIARQQAVKVRSDSNFPFH